MGCTVENWREIERKIEKKKKKKISKESLQSLTLTWTFSSSVWHLHAQPRWWSREPKLRANHSVDAPSVAAWGPVTDLDMESMWQGCLLCPQLLAIWLLDGDLFLFQEAAFTTVLFWFPLVSPTILALKALCKLQGGPSWCLSTPAESDPVLLLDFTGQAALLISAELQTKVFSYISENISHITCIFDMTQRQLTLWDFKFNWSKSQVNELCDGINPWMEKKNWSLTSVKKSWRWNWKWRCYWSSFSLLSLFLPLSYPLKYLQYLDRLLPCISAKMLFLLHGMNETN